MAGLRRSDVAGPGFTRRRHGRGFGYCTVDGERVRDEDELARFRALVIPPAWRREHVRMRRGELLFEYEANGGLPRTQVVADPDVIPVLQALRRRREPDPELLAYRNPAVCKASYVDVLRRRS
jgi:hypothetical protein